MERAATATEISDIPELARLVHEVAESGEARLLTENGEPIAVLSPAPRRRRPRRKHEAVLTPEDSFWNIVGMFEASEGPTDVSANKHKYLAEAYLPKTT